MKATGIVRRIDDLGRVVIPKEIRRTLKIREGDPLEIFTSNDGEVIFKKYSPLGEIIKISDQYTEVLNRVTGKPTLITDRDIVIAASGIAKKDILEKRISNDLRQLNEGREKYTDDNGDKPLYPIKDYDCKASAAYPIISSGDITGAVILLKNNDNEKISESEKKLIQVASTFLGKQTEE